MKNIFKVLSFTFFMALMSCVSTRDIDYSNVDYSGPPTMIYKLKNDYTKLVPVRLNEEKTKIVSYPAPKDLFNKEGELRFPVPLAKGYFLDEIGVAENTAYISISIDEYAHLIHAPTADSLFQLIVDKDPFKRMYNLGNRKQYINHHELVKEIVESGKYRKFKSLK